ncbi:DUF6624 domain-containing protein [Deinococcus koreensis]|uniref:Uncharacterized protein n=1 Tax=Deinococcus koreensis TaxID=2054903 RepID=A0A2K3UZ00_9DEIO|nr:DUF6624 domain-containing protein [Deinococcus koreensis]PNY81759.1 hypothetical protein CVO96_10560 [Deinococcus koreensis]
MRPWLILALLGLPAPALAQSPALPDPAACARLIAPQTRLMSPELTLAVRATTQSYAGQVQGIYRRMALRPLTPAEVRELQPLERELTGYVDRLLGTWGWPADPAGRAAVGQLLLTPTLKWCAGPLALSAATTPAERQQAAGLIDQGLTGLGGKQRYGTAFSVRRGRVTPLPIEDAAGVDARRAGLGLPPLAEELTRVQAQQPPPKAPPGLRRPVVVRPVCQPFTTPAALNTPLTAAQIGSLANEAARLVEQDQASRTGQPGARSMSEVDRESTLWLKEVLRQRGWPSANRSDPELAFDAWLLAQHADLRPSLQACVLDLLAQQRSTPAEARNLAYLTDRVRLAQGQPQVYGTQVMYDDVQGKASPRMLDDPAGVNARRANVGLEPIEEYLKGFERPRP